MCELTVEPAATLLLPYFEVDLSHPEEGNTIFTINNAGRDAVLAHVTFWTDWSYPTINFDIFLTGYDVQTVNLADVFLRGDLPITADEQSDSQDTISPHGGFRPDEGATSSPEPDLDGSFEGCENFFPFYVNPLVQGPSYLLLTEGHTGQIHDGPPHQPTGGTCLGADFGDNVARGYITIDSVSRCSTDTPADEGYFGASGTGVANNVNQLWGDWIYIDRANGFANGSGLVHIRALDGFDSAGDGTSDPRVDDPETGETFYGRYVEQGEDNRQPLGASWGVRYLNNSLFAPGGTEFFVWRDPSVGLVEGDVGTACGPPGSSEAGPEWHPLDEVAVLAFDEFENVVQLCPNFQGCGIIPCDPNWMNETCFPLAAQRLSSENLAYSGLSSPWEAGWMYLDLRIPETQTAQTAQSFVYATHSAVGLISVGLPAVELGSACDDLGTVDTRSVDGVTGQQ